jgi:phosphosulfolactate phosphohydrolase-like enzyme
MAPKAGAATRINRKLPPLAEHDSRNAAGAAFAEQIRAACAVYQHLTRAELEGCGSARELNRHGFAADIALCLEEDVSDLACQFQGRYFTAHR